MTTLVIHAPDYRVKNGGKSFEAILEDGIGPGYAIWDKWVKIIRSGLTVVLLRKDKNKKRAEGILDTLVGTNRYVNGVQRHDIHIKGLTIVPYKSEKLNRYGVAVIDC